MHKADRPSLTSNQLAKQVSNSQSLEANLDGLEIGDSIHISSINLQEGVKPAISDRDFTIATIAPPTVMKIEEEKPVEAEDGVEGAEVKEGSDETKQEAAKEETSEEKKSEDNEKK